LISFQPAGVPQGGDLFVRSFARISVPRLPFASEHCLTPDITEMADLPALL
jgi:hypothetical protein